MYVAYSNWSYIKNHSSFRDEYAKSAMKWLSYYAGKRESRRILGEFVLREQDLRDFTIYEDGCVCTSWYIDNHEPDPGNAAVFKDPWLSRGCLTPLDFLSYPFQMLLQQGCTQHVYGWQGHLRVASGFGNHQSDEDMRYDG